MAVKVCRKCGRVLDVSEFYKDRSHPDGLKHWCKQCMRDADPRVNGTQVCEVCGKEKHVTEYRWITTERTARNTTCKDCERKQIAEFHKKYGAKKYETDYN